MSLHPEEAQYWDDQCASGIRDNIWKRQWIVRKLLELPLIGKNILEIGVGIGNTFGALNAVFLKNFSYLGIEVSPKYCEFARKVWGLNVVNTDIRQIPAKDKEFDYVIALDSLEHIRPEDRTKGYQEIDRVLKDDGKIVINMPLTDSRHDVNFDHGFREKEFWEVLELFNLDCVEFERMQLRTEKMGTLCYGWGIGVRKKEQ